MAQDYYDVLGVRPGATPAEVRRAARLVRQGLRAEAPIVQSMYAPEEAEAIHARIDEAFRILTDPETARRYEKYHRAARSGSAIPREPASFFDAVHTSEGPFEPLHTTARVPTPRPAADLAPSPRERVRPGPAPVLLVRPISAPSPATAQPSVAHAEVSEWTHGGEAPAASALSDAEAPARLTPEPVLEGQIAASAEPQAEPLSIVALEELPDDHAAEEPPRTAPAITFAEHPDVADDGEDDEDLVAERVIRVDFAQLPAAPHQALLPPRSAAPLGRAWTPLPVPAAAPVQQVPPAAPRLDPVMSPAAQVPAWEAPERAPALERFAAARAPAPSAPTAAPARTPPAVAPTRPAMEPAMRPAASVPLIAASMGPGSDPTARKLPGAVVGVLADTQASMQAVAVDLQPRTSYRPWNRDTVRTRAVGPLQVEPLTAAQVAELAETCGGFGGTFLQQARRKLGVSVEDIADRTKIMSGTLRAIEENNVSDLPAAVYVKGYLQQITRLLKLPQAEVVEGWMRQNGLR